jgi:hypothetical protein
VEYISPSSLLSFPLPSLSFFLESLSHTMSIEQPLELPNGQPIITSRIIIFYGPKLQFATLPPIDANSSYFEEIAVTVSLQPRRPLSFSSSSSHTSLFPSLLCALYFLVFFFFSQISEGIYFQKRECFIGFESSTQDVVSDLGPPDKIYFKEQDKMKIHSSSGVAVGMKGTEYFYNYFSLGLDILFDVTKHTVKKIILHTNFPSHYDFNRYTKCNFRITKSEGSPAITADSKVCLSQLHSALRTGPEMVVCLFIVYCLFVCLLFVCLFLFPFC